MMRTWVLLAVALPALPAMAQFQPASAHADMYFPQFADGGSFAERWQTTFTFLNPNVNAVTVDLYLASNSGGGLALDFALGGGPSSHFRFTVPANGLTILRSTGASSSIVTGWAEAFASLPIQATVAFRQFIQDTAKAEITAEATLPSVAYSSAATPLLGVAIANPFANSVNLQMTLRDRNGSMVGTRNLTIPSLAHVSFNLNQQFTGLGPGFQGVLTISGVKRSDQFAAWSLGSDGLLLSTLPPGRYGWPPLGWDQAQEVFKRIWGAATTADPRFGTTPPTFRVLEAVLTASGPDQMNAIGDANDINITWADLELLNDSPSELAFLIAHEMGHVFQYRNGGLQLFDQNMEFDADFWGLLLSGSASYDVYAAAGVLGKLSFATGSAGLATQWEASISALFGLDPHSSINTRLDLLYGKMQRLCSANPGFCQTYKSLFHPDLPPVAPLVHSGNRSAQ